MFKEMMFKEIENWSVECVLPETYGAMTVRVDFYHRENTEDSTEFCINPWDKKELAELFEVFCKESGFKNVSVDGVTVVRVAKSFEVLEALEEGTCCKAGCDSNEKLCSRFKIVRDGKELYLTLEELRSAYYEQQWIFDRSNIEMNMESYLSDAMYDYIRGDGDVKERFIDFAATELRRQQDKYERDYEMALSVAFKYAEKQFRPKLFVDMDGTLARFIPQTSVEDLYKTGYFLNLPPLQNVVDAIRIVIQQYKEVDVYLLSCVLGKKAEVEKDAWMSVYLPELREEKRIFLPNGENKWQYVQKKLFGYSAAKNSFLLDDHTPNLMKWAPGKGIKLINDINGKGGTWQGAKVSYDMDPEALAAEIVSFVKRGDGHE